MVSVNRYSQSGAVDDQLVEWIMRELNAISEASYGSFPDVQLVPLAVAPEKPRTGMLVYADGSDWNPGSGAGVYVYTGSAWSKL